MATYIRKPQTVEAFQWTKQPREDWPQWARDYEGLDSMGQLVPLGNSAVGTLIVSAKGKVVNANNGDWLVHVDKREILVVPGHQFGDLYEPAPAS